MAVLNHRDSPCRVWRNNVGQLPDSRGVPLKYGLCPGSADLIGLVTTTGQFLAVEVKTAVGRMSPIQKAWKRTIEALGGMHMVLRSEEEARAFVDNVRQLRPTCTAHSDCLANLDLAEQCARARRTIAA